jgi:hypothetical protein
MSNVGGVSNVGLVNLPPTVEGGSLTVDALMLHCASQLNHLDDAIHAQMVKQNTARDQQDKMGQLRALLSGEQIAGEGSKTKDVANAFKAAYDSLPPGDPRRNELSNGFRTYIATACFRNDPLLLKGVGNKYDLATMDASKANELNGLNATSEDNNVNSEEMKEIGAFVDNVSTSIGKGAELDMINLQSMVSKRQMAIQITTQLISKMNDSLSSIVQQIGK